MISPWLLAALLGVVGGEWLALTARWMPYVRRGFPLGAEPLPLTDLPEGEGETATVLWWVDGPCATFRANGAGLWGLHGVVDFLPHRGRIHLEVTWAPPWTLLALVLAAGLLGTALGLGPAPAVICSLVVLGLGVLYRQAALRAAAELRWTWSQDEGPH